MNYIHFAAVSATMFAVSLTPAFAAPKPAGTQAMFDRIGKQFGEISDKAFSLRELAMKDADRGRQIQGLEALKKDVNKISGEVQTLESQRASLTEWQGKALDQIEPMLSEIADSTGKAIQTCNTSRSGLRTHPYTSETAKVSRQAEAVAELLGNKLRIVRALEKDQRLGKELGEHAGS